MTNTTLSFNQLTTNEYNKARFGFDEAVHKSIDLLFDNSTNHIQNAFNLEKNRYYSYEVGQIRRVLDYWDKKYETNGRVVHFLVLGCKDGENDFLYILQKIEEIASKFKNLTFHLVGIEILEAPYENMIEKMKVKGYSYNPNLKCHTIKDFNNIKLFPILGDIEKYSDDAPLVKYTKNWQHKFDFIFSFYVVHHLVNVPLFINFMIDKLLTKREEYKNNISIKSGSWYNLKADINNPVGIIENNNKVAYKPNNLFEFVSKYNQDRFENEGISYDKVMKASKTDILNRANFFLKKEKEIKIDVKKQVWKSEDFRNLFSYEAQYAPIRWGMKFEEISKQGIYYPPYKDIEVNHNNIELEFSFVLEEYYRIKSKPFKRIPREEEEYAEAKSFFFHSFYAESYRKNREFSYKVNHTNSHDLSIKTQYLILQRMLGSGGIKPSTRFATVIDKTSIYSNQNFENIIPPFASICRAKEDNSEEKYEIKSLKQLVRHYGSVFESPDEQSLTSIIFGKKFENYEIWIVKKSYRNFCEIIPFQSDSQLKAVYIEIKQESNFVTIENKPCRNIRLSFYFGIFISL